MSNLTRYTMVVRRDHEGFATAAGKVRQNGEWVKFDDIKELLNTATNIGDSVYADYSTGALCLYTDNGEGAENKIIIDSDTLISLFKFVEKCLDVKITIKPV